MAYEFKLPDLGEGLTEGEIARWLVSEGQEIAEDDPLVEIQTDKTTVEIPSPAAGKVSRILAGEGDIVPVGTVIVVIGEDGAAAAERPVRESGPVEGVPGEPGGSPGGRGRPQHASARDGWSWRGGLGRGRRVLEAASERVQTLRRFGELERYRARGAGAPRRPGRD